MSKFVDGGLVERTRRIEGRPMWKDDEVAFGMVWEGPNRRWATVIGTVAAVADVGFCAEDQLLGWLKVGFGMGLPLVLMHLESRSCIAADLIGVEDGEGLQNEEPLLILVTGLVVHDRLGNRLPEDDTATPMPLFYARRAFGNAAAEACHSGKVPHQRDSSPSRSAWSSRRRGLTPW